MYSNWNKSKYKTNETISQILKPLSTAIQLLKLVDWYLYLSGFENAARKFKTWRFSGKNLINPANGQNCKTFSAKAQYFS